MKPFIFVLLLAVLTCAAQAQAPAPAPKSADAEDISGMYTFLQEGEFVQINIEDGLQVTGFISRYGDTDSDKGEFLDHMFSGGELKGNHLRFKTKTVHGISYEFTGTVERGDGKTPSDEGYRVLRGKLTQYTEEDNGKKTTAKSREVTFKSFPQDAQ